MAEITGGELLLRCLKEEEVTVLFGVLDGSFNPFLAKLDDYGMRFINARHEAAAAHMAEAWARIRGEPAVVIGGTSLFGGLGGVGRTVIGALIIKSLEVGLIHCRVSSFWQKVAIGSVIIVAVWIDRLQRRRKA